MTNATPDLPLILAHRGASADAPENSLAAFALAARQGADGVELDARLTSDGAVVVLHDDTVDATTDGKGMITGMTLAQARQLHLRPRGGATPEHGEPPPLLSEVIELLRPMSVLLNVEIKASRSFELAEAVAKIVAESGIAGQVLVSSFDQRALTYLQEHHPTMRRALLFPPSALSGFMGGTGWLTGAVAMGCEAAHPFWRLATPKVIARAHDLGLNVNVWTVDDEATARKLTVQGVDGIITNRPTAVRAAISAPATVR